MLDINKIKIGDILQVMDSSRYYYKVINIRKDTQEVFLYNLIPKNQLVGWFHLSEFNIHFPAKLTNKPEWF